MKPFSLRAEAAGLVRCAVGGVLMGLANLVPGISGGTMLLAAGVYPRFIDAIADVTRLRFNLRAVASLGVIVMAAGLAIGLLAGVVRDLVIHHRWIMYSLFIGLTLGGAPVVWKLIGQRTRAVWIGAACGFIGMAALAYVQGAGSGGGAGGDSSSNAFMLGLGGVAGASAMILPGVSGGYLLLVLGQYVPILDAIDAAKVAIRQGDVAAAMPALWVILPVGIGVVVGIAVVSNVLRWLLHRYERATLGVLLGLLLGAVVGLWPFQAPRPPADGEVIRGVTVTTENVSEIKAKYWPTAYFTPEAKHLGGSLGLIIAGFAATAVIARFGRTNDRPSTSDDEDGASDADDAGVSNASIEVRQAAGSADIDSNAEAGDFDNRSDSSSKDSNSHT